MTRKILCAVALAALSAGAMLPNVAQAQVGVSITIGTPPPPPRYERMPAPRVGFVWAPGFWDWSGNTHVWVGGRWEQERVGYDYVRPEWRQGSNGWVLDRGGWKGGKGNGKGPPHCPPGQAKKGNC